MADEPLHTTNLRGWLQRMQDGDAAARDELLHHARDRLERLTRKMLQDFPGVKRWEQTDDVLQNSLQRLLRALGEVRPDSTRTFFALAALQIRRELLDLVKHYYGPLGPGAHHDSHVPDRADSTPGPALLAEWCEVHRLIERLPEKEREVVDLLYYQGLRQAEAAALLEVSVRTVQNRWQSALLHLHDLLDGHSP
jgi:RNA polymerase sigma-70 factor (ECF subfamily)